MPIKDIQDWREELMDDFCVMFERAAREDVPIDWVERMQAFISKTIAKERVEERKFVLGWLKQISHDLSEDSFDRIIMQFEMLAPQETSK